MSDEAAGDGFLATLGNVYVAPGRGFRAIAARPRWDAPLALAVAVGLAFTALWVSKVDALEFMRAQNEESGAMERVPAEKRAEVLQGQARAVKAFAWMMPLFFAPAVCALLAGLFLVVYRFFYAAELTFARSFAVVLWTYLAYKLVTSPLAVLVLWLREDWNTPPESAIQASVAALLDRATTSRAVYSLADSLDLFAGWALTLLSIGYAAATGLKTRQAKWGVLVPWAAYVLAAAGLAALF
jgi:Yip1-like protein